MAGLAGYTYQKITQKLGRLGLKYVRPAKGDHEIWENTNNGNLTTIPHCSGDMPEGTLKAILKQAGISKKAFLNA